jgi:phage tail sheath protein FI
MATYLHPGVYVEELPSGSKPIEAVGTSTACFIGYSLKGPMSEPTLISSWVEYVSQFGGLQPSETQMSAAKAPLGDGMGYGVYAFFQNGGSSAYVIRAAQADAEAASGDLLQTSDDTALITFTAINEGVWGNDLVIVITQNVAEFSVAVGSGLGSEFVAKEEFTEISFDNTLVNYLPHKINGVSELIVLQVHNPSDIAAEIAISGSSEVILAGGLDGTAPAVAEYNIIFAKLLKYRDINMILLPGQYWDSDAQRAIINTAIAHCEAMKNRMLILDLKPGDELNNANEVKDLSLPTQTYVACYYPWVLVSNAAYNVDKNPGAAKQLLVGSSGFAAGLWAKTDARRGVWKAPAGIESSLLGVADLEFKVENAEQNYLNPLGVNALRKMPGYGPVVWGARTAATKADPEWRYVPVRRTAMFIEESLYNGIQWAVFEGNDHRLWSSLRINIESFMNGLFRAGAFQGEKSSDAYFVRCNLGDTMTQGDIDRGQVVVIIGFAPLKPAEFVIVRLQQMIGQQ